MSPLRYCQTCILPHTRPNIRFYADGSCNCATGDKKDLVDWDERRAQFSELARSVRVRGARYDCVIPVSGGKDSTWQTLTALEHGLKPLCVTWKTPARNTIGEANLQNLIRLGVEHIDFSISPATERLFTRKAFVQKGSPLIPMHMALHAIPLQIAVGMQVPLIIWGENSAYEYGSDDESIKGMRLTRAWLREWGVTNGTTSEDWVDDELSARAMAPYYWPTEEEQDTAGVRAVFLGHYYRWDPQHTFEVAERHGFRGVEKPKTGLYAFADIDDDFLVTIHHWLKWYKFGFTRLWDNLSLEIRNGRLSRAEAIEMVQEAGEDRPLEEIAKFCEYVDISEARFYEIAESYRNRDIWSKGADGRWRLEDFLVEGWEWS